MKNVIKKIAQDYNVNAVALKQHIKESGLKPKSVSKVEVLEILYINAPDLFYCREDENGAVEYLDPSLNKKLCYEMKVSRVNKDLKESDYE